MKLADDLEVPRQPDESKPISVAQLDRRLRMLIESNSSGVWVQGEVGGLKISASSHAYFSLKDEHDDAMVEAVAYRDTALRFRKWLSNGARVVVRGKATLWAPRGRLQFVVDTVRPAGRGALFEALERLKLLLQAEGLFDPARKKPVPNNAQTLAVVTSAQGAVIHDIVRVAFRRGAPRILLSPAPVQGDDAPERIVAAIDLVERVRGVDVLIVGRGGGSFEDLLAFQDERVVRRIAACRIPVVSAVGHEIDVTLADLVADARAATPSQAAELVVADGQALTQALLQVTTRLRRAMLSRIIEDRAVLDQWRHRMGDPRGPLRAREQRFDDLLFRLRETGIRILGVARRSQDVLTRRLVSKHPRAVLGAYRTSVLALEHRLASASRRELHLHHATTNALSAKLRALSPISVLARGYSIVLDPRGKAVVAARDVAQGDLLSIRLHSGKLNVNVVECREDPSDPPL